MKPNVNELRKTIQGWGADLDPGTRPGVPREKAPPEGSGAHWLEPERQRPRHKIHVTIERPGLTSVFGTSCPPKGLSGILRGFGYRFGEARLARWLTLLAADRIDVIESFASELLRGKPENIIQEMGLEAELKGTGHFARYHRRRLVLALGLGAAALGTNAFLSRKKAA